MVTGSIAPVGLVTATRMVPPGLPAAAEEAARRPEPKAPARAPSRGTDMPNRAPWRRKSRRPRRPAANSSITWFSIGVSRSRIESINLSFLFTGLLLYKDKEPTSNGDLLAGRYSDLAELLETSD